MSTADTRPSRRLPARSPHLLAGLGLALFVALLYWALLFTNRVLANGDILLYFYPYRDYVAAALRGGHLPFWNPYLFSGAPLLANTQAAVLYPLHWPLLWLPVTAQVYWSAALHTWLFGYGGYLLLRRWGYGVWPGMVTALVLAGSGLVGGMIGHLNQLNVAAWLPWAVLCIPDFAGAPTLARSWPRLLGSSAALALVVALMLLAGHSQTFYIGMFALGVWAFLPLVDLPACRKAQIAAGGRTRACLRPAAFRLAVYLAGAAMGALLAAPQLLPTLELNGLGLRSGGLSYLDATSFSLKPLQILWTLLPSYGLADLSAVFDTPAYTEFVAYVGLVGIVLAALGAWRGHGLARRFGLLFVLLGLLLALGRWNPLYYVLYTVAPGFDLFRVPARWLLLFTLGAGVLAGVGAAWLANGAGRPHRVPARWLGLLLVVLVGGELLLAARALPHTQPTAPQAVYDLRTAPAHLLSDPGRAPFAPAAGRFLGMSTITYDPGDMADYQRIFLDSGELTPATFADLVIAQKVQELLVPNLSLFWRIPAVDGFDGGLLPLQRYNLLAQLLVPADQLVPDGRLREQVRTVPDTALLNRLDVQYLITDKVRDLWYADVYYDRQVGATLSAGALDTVTMTVAPPFEATHVDLIATLPIDPAQAAPLSAESRLVATVTVVAADGGVQQIGVTGGGAPGSLLADAALDSALARSSGAAVAFRDVDSGRQEYRARLALEQPTTPATITVTAVDPALPVTVQAATLYDARTGMFSALLPSDRGRYARVHSGDVKIYENQDRTGRTYLADHVETAASAVEALARLRAGLPPGAAIVEGGQPLAAGAAQGEAAILDYAAERVIVRTRSDAPALLVLSDAYYPGWHARIDDAPAAILPANVLFRGVYVPAGEHVVTFTFAPSGWSLGLWLAAAGLALVLLAALAALAGHIRAARRAGV